jgi:5-methylcytosine-specific restriction protein A
VPVMGEPVSPVRRKPLTYRQRIEQHDRCGGVCCVCNLPIARGEPFIDEHIIPLAMGGSNAPENRGIAHIKCATRKTKKDASVLAKTLKMRAKHLGIDLKPNRRRLQGRKFDGTPSGGCK